MLIPPGEVSQLGLLVLFGHFSTVQKGNPDPNDKVYASGPVLPIEYTLRPLQISLTDSSEGNLGGHSLGAESTRGSKSTGWGPGGP